jgi:hypothetical protein
MAETTDLPKLLRRLELTKTVAGDGVYTLNELFKVVTEIHDTLDKLGVPEVRNIVRIINDLHPLLDGIIEAAGLEYFKPYSDITGELHIEYTHDTQTLDLEDWNNDWVDEDGSNLTPAPHCFRASTRLKMNQDLAYNTDKAYAKLNQSLMPNISREFFNERERIVALNIAHDYHIAGDKLYFENIIKPIQAELIGSLDAVMGKTIVLINWINPERKSVKINNDTYGPCDVEGKKIVCDLRGNKLTRFALEGSDESAITIEGSD